MRNRLAALATAGLLAFGVPATASAQFSMGVGGGPSIPMSDLGDVANTGFHVQGSLGLSVPLLPVGVRADVLWQRFPFEGDGNFTSVGGLLNGVLSMPLPMVRPYAIAGVGMMRNSISEADGSESEFAFGIGAGVQLSLLGFGGFAEARFLDFGDGARAIPLTIGITF